jgi:23S rRNA (uracil1939-C5)-methyltransferase
VLPVFVVRAALTPAAIPRYYSFGMAESREEELRVEKLVAGGDGLASMGGKAVFVPFALPGERVLARIASEKRDYARAELVRVLEPSPRRVEAPCPLYGICGGCNLQHLEYAGQLEAKSRIVADVFARTAKIETGEVPVRPSPPFAYRNRMQLHLMASGRLGLSKRSSSDLVEISGCPVACPAIDEWMGACAGTDRARAMLGKRSPGDGRFIVFGREERLWLEGRDELAEVPVAGRSIRFPVRGFFQSNLSLLDAFVSAATSGLAGERAADLYCGVGLFGSFLASSFRRVVCVEENASSLAAAKANLPGQGHELHAASAEAWTRSASAAEPFDLVLADPPRTGLGPELRQWLAASRPPTIVYLSCDPVTLARDAKELVGAGYELGSVEAFDFYPQTSHVECHARFTLR